MAEEASNTQEAPEGETFTSADVERMIVDRQRNLRAELEAEQAKTADLTAKIGELEPKLADLEPKLTELTQERDTLKTENATAKADALRYSVALNKGLDAGLIGRLNGTTQEELEADADELLKLVAPKPSGLEGGSRQTVSVPSMNDMLRGIARN